MGRRKTKRELEKERRINEEKERLLSIIGEDNSQKQAVLSLVDNAAFMSVSLQDLQSIINKKGYTEEYQNGANQAGIKKSSEIEIYNTMIKNYLSAVKQICDLIPREGAEDEFTAFVSRAK